MSEPAPNRAEPRGRPIQFAISTLLVVVVLWVMFALIWACGNGNMQLPDREATDSLKTNQMPTAEYATRMWGLNGPHPLVTQYPHAENQQYPLVRLVRPWRDREGRAMLDLEVMVSKRSQPVTMHLAHDQFKWEVRSDASPSVTFDFQGSVPVNFSPKGYTVWRFLTFRGPDWEFDPLDNSEMPLQFLTDQVVISCTIPDTPEWTKFHTPS